MTTEPRWDQVARGWWEMLQNSRNGAPNPARNPAALARLRRAATPMDALEEPTVFDLYKKLGFRRGEVELRLPRVAAAAAVLSQIRTDVEPGSGYRRRFAEMLGHGERPPMSPLRFKCLRARPIHHEGRWRRDINRSDCYRDRLVKAMRAHLVFLLYAPVGAMGGVAVGEQRAGFDRPGKSAILGLIAAGLGLDRSDESAHTALADGYGLGLGEIASGRLLFDYHTAQMPPQRKKRRFATRREELMVSDVRTILSVREYRTDPAYLVVLWKRGAPRWSLATIEEALRRPHFTLYFGRKACPLGVPLDPRVVEADDPHRAMVLYLAGRTPEQIKLLHDLRLDEQPSVLALDLDGTSGRSNTLRIERRRDGLESRRRWQFGLRSEVLVDGRNE
jgi:CRISPR system Cascade subunit CasD